MTYDIVIRNGDVVDGSGAPRVRADVAIDGGRIVQVGKVTDGGREEIDAEGHVVTPGFVDGHTHMDAQLFWDPLGTSSCWHGVTTVVMGNCGFTLAPVRPEAPELVVRNLERAEDIAPEAMAAGITWSWEHFSDYLDVVERLPMGINYSVYLGHSALRTWAMGERAFEEEASEDDLRVMEAELRDGLDAGAMGFTTSRNRAHATSDDRPVASRLASWHEVERLVGVMTEAGHGLFEIAPEDASQLAGTPEQTESQGRMEELAIASGRPVTFGIVPCPWQEQQLEMLDRTNARGGRMIGQTHSRGTTLITSFKTRMLFDNLPEWKELRDLPLDEQRRLLNDPDVRNRLVNAADTDDYKAPRGPEIRKPDYGTLRVWKSPTGDNPLVADVARERGVNPVDLMIQLCLDTDFEQMFIQPTLPRASKDSDDLARLMRHPNTVMTFSDAGAHVRMISDCSLQTYLLAYWVREREEFTLEEGVQMITSTPADVWGFGDRGLLRPGFMADVNIFDPATVGPVLPTVETDLPGGAKRLRQGSSGFLSTLVAGEVVLRNNEHTGALPGRLLRAG